MKIISLNVRGLGKIGEDTINWVKDLIRIHNPDIFAIQESKRKKLNDGLIEIIWGNNNFEYVYKPAVDFSCGTILIWNPSKFIVSQVVEQEFFLAIKGRWVDVDDWIICGDFNEVRRESERKNCVFVESRAKMFNDFIDKSNLIEIPLGGLKFTRISDDGLKYSKLDRFLVSGACISMWVDLAACTLDRKHSDHCPIILKVCANNFGPRLTGVFNNWFEDVECEELIKDA
ncbi:uncharacterized protein [Rutidosis leptorrhynchoides]|uniref:uncharacterized protein n=1 Tax=Rutidosis leptorrhynchoides TaxID=125765 RepID=UPI003A9965A1